MISVPKVISAYARSESRGVFAEVCGAVLCNKAISLYVFVNTDAHIILQCTS